MSRQCCLIENKKRCQRAATNTKLSKRVLNRLISRFPSVSLDEKAEHTYICDVHKRLTEQLNNDKRKRSQSDVPEVNFSALHMNTLKRYKKHYKLSADTASKSDLVEVVSQHFKLQNVVEMDTIMLFSHMIKNNMNRFDSK
eukprot:m.339211 g.339211  ORF g.339211 m.339211 type:complete len:141 (+) comp18705_c0_seq1:57-479(+)